MVWIGVHWAPLYTDDEWVSSFQCTAAAELGFQTKQSDEPTFSNGSEHKLTDSDPRPAEMNFNDKEDF